MDRPTFLPWRWYGLALAAVLGCGTLPRLALAATPTLEGQWHVMSATYQLGGLITYDFRGDTLTIVHTTNGGKDQWTGERVPKRYVSRFVFEIDGTVRPNRLIMKSISAPGYPSTTSVEAMEFKNGELWLTRNAGWVTGLRRMEPPPQQQ